MRPDGTILLADHDPSWPRSYEREEERIRGALGELYLATKRELAARRWRDVQDYADAKADVVEDILTRAG